MIRVKDLRNHTGEPGPHPILLCNKCGSEFSANAGDYFTAPAQHVIKCCETPVKRVYKSVVYRIA